MRNIIVLLVAAVMMVGLAATAYAIPEASFIAFGTSTSDSNLYQNDDGYSGQIALSSPFKFFGSQETSLWVNNNGNITFSGGLSIYTPNAFPNNNGWRIIAPYWADVDTRGTRNATNNNVFYSERTGASDLTVVSNIVHAAFGGSFSATDAFVATWDHVGFYSVHDYLKNTFQLALATDGIDSYAIFNYLDDGMTWETGDASGGSGGFGGYEAVAGFDKGDNINAYTIPGSLAAGIANVLEDGSNMNVPGQWVFRINQGTIIPPTTVPEPASLSLLGFGLLGLFGIRRKK